MDRYVPQFCDCGLYERVRIYPMGRSPYRAYRLHASDSGVRRLLEADGDFCRWVYEEVPEGSVLSGKDAEFESRA